MIANRRGRDDVQAGLVDLRRIERDVVDDDDDLRLFAFARIEP